MLRTPPERKAPKRYLQGYDDSPTANICAKTDDKMPTLRKIKSAASRHTSQRLCSTFNFAQPHPRPTQPDNKNHTFAVT